MKQSIPFFAILAILMSCATSGNKKAADLDSTSFGAVSSRVIETTKSYLANQLKNSTIAAESNGDINIKGGGTSFLVTARDINIGLIDEDNSLDAIVSCLVTESDTKKFHKQLILLNKGGIKVVKEFVSELRVMMISNRTVFGELPKYGPDSPLRNCPECKENVKYKLVADSLQLIR